MSRQSIVLSLLLTIFLTVLQRVCEAEYILTEVQNFSTSASNVSGALYSSQYNLLFLRDSSSGVRVLNASNGTLLNLRTPSATGTFTDFAFSPSGRYLFVADYGGTNIGFNTPSNPSYVNRYDLQTGTWTSAQAPAIGYTIAPVDDNRVLLLGVNQTVDLTLNSYAPGSMTQLTYVSSGYSGNVEFSPSLNRIIYNSTGLSSNGISAFTLIGNTSTGAESVSGAPNSGNHGLLSSDGTAYYYTQKALQASDLTKTIATFSEQIKAAGPAMAFGSTHYFDPSTGAVLGTVPFTPQTWTVDANGKDVWAVQQPVGGSATLRHYQVLQANPWIALTGGSWADTSKWSLNALPDGKDYTADFGQVTLAADAIVTLDGDHTIGHLVFGDLGASRNWTVAPGTGGVLNLQTSGVVPTITVSNQTATINAVIAGNQGLFKGGPGTLILAAANTYTGGTTISAGSLQIGSDNNLGGGSVAINAATLRATANIDSSRLIALQNAASSIQVDGGFTYAALAGAIVSGTGSLTMLGTGTLDLTAATVSYTGTTSVNAGTLNLTSFGSTAQVTVAANAVMNVSGAALALGSVSNSGIVNFTNTSGTIALAALTGGGTTNFSGGASLPTHSTGTISVGGPASITTASGGLANLNGLTASIGTLSNASVKLGLGTALSVASGTQASGGISGQGSLTKTGTGTLILGFDNTYSGGTTVSGGTLQIGNGGAVGSIAGNVTNNGVLVFNRSDAYTFSGLISGSGSVRQSGAGTLTLTNLNTYAGATTINSGGTLQLGDGTTAGAVSGNVANNGTLILNTPAAGQTFPGSVSGIGSIMKLGAGTQVFTGTNTNSGGTTISAGILQVGSGGTTGSITGNVTNNAALVFNRSDNVNFSGTITGTGRVEQAGTGTLTLTATVSSALTANGRIVVGPSANFNGDVTTGASGRLENGGGAIHIRNLDNAGLLSGTTNLTGTFFNRATGDIRLSAGQTMLVQSTAAHTNAGLVEVLGNATSQASFETIGPLTNASGGNSLIAARYGSLRFDGGLTNMGSLSLSYGLNDVFGDVDNVAGGTIAVAGGAGVTFYDDVLQNGTMVVSAVGGTRSSAVFLGSFGGAGGFTGGGDVFIMGDLKPGNSPAEVTYEGNLYLGPTSKMVMELGGLQSGNQADKVEVTGALYLGGQLTIELYNGFEPAIGDSFDLFGASTISGSFNSFALPRLSNGMSWDMGNLYSNGTVTVVPEPCTLVLMVLGGLTVGLRRKHDIIRAKRKGARAKGALSAHK